MLKFVNWNWNNWTRGWLVDVIQCIKDVLWLSLVDMITKTTSRLPLRLYGRCLKFSLFNSLKKITSYLKTCAEVGLTLTKVDFCSLSICVQRCHICGSSNLSNNETTLRLVSALSTAITLNMRRIVRSQRIVFSCVQVVLKFVTLWWSRGSDV